MVFGTLYTFPVSSNPSASRTTAASLMPLTIDIQSDHPRSIGIKAVAKANNLELRIVQEPRIAEHLEVSELGKVPAFRGEDGLKLFECVAIAIYGPSTFLNACCFSRRDYVEQHTMVGFLFFPIKCFVTVTSFTWSSSNIRIFIPTLHIPVHDKYRFIN